MIILILVRLGNLFTRRNGCPLVVGIQRHYEELVPMPKYVGKNDDERALDQKLKKAKM